jgi:hypothetical protein
MSRTRTLARAIGTGALVDELIQRRNSIRESEEKLRGIRSEFIKAGRLDLARQTLGTPAELTDLAGFLWYQQRMVISEETMMPSRPSKHSIRFPIKPQSTNRKFSQKEFVMERRDGEGRPLTKSRARAITISFNEGVKPMIAAKIRSDVLDRRAGMAR